MLKRFAAALSLVTDFAATLRAEIIPVERFKNAFGLGLVTLVVLEREFLEETLPGDDAAESVEDVGLDLFLTMADVTFRGGALLPLVLICRRT